MMVRREILQETPVGSMTAVEDGSLDALGKALFANLEEHWEISQSLKELRELKKQNEEAIIIKMEEQQNLEDNELAQTIAKEIEALGEVMSNNEKIEIEMENNLERNMKEKKQIEEKMLVASTQYASTGNPNKYYDSLEKSFEHLSGDKILLNDKAEIEKEVTGTRFVYFEPIVPRKNMTLSIFGNFKEIERAKQILKEKLESLKSVITIFFSFRFNI